MTTSQSTTFSPSRRSTTRSTPCVLGCCGPMLSTSSSVSNIAPRTFSSSLKAQVSRMKNQRPSFNIRLFPRLPQLQPVERILHQQLAWTFEWIVLALRETLPVVRHQNPPTVRMPGEVHPEHVVHLALEP